MPNNRGIDVIYLNKQHEDHNFRILIRDLWSRNDLVVYYHEIGSVLNAISMLPPECTWEVTALKDGWTDEGPL